MWFLTHHPTHHPAPNRFQGIANLSTMCLESDMVSPCLPARLGDCQGTQQKMPVTVVDSLAHKQAKLPQFCVASVRC